MKHQEWRLSISGEQVETGPAHSGHCSAQEVGTSGEWRHGAAGGYLGDIPTTHTTLSTTPHQAAKHHLRHRGCILAPIVSRRTLAILGQCLGQQCFVRLSPGDIVKCDCDNVAKGTFPPIVGYVIVVNKYAMMCHCVIVLMSR